MARNADIRVWLSSVLPTEDLTVVTSVLKDVIAQAEALARGTSSPAGGVEIRIADETRSRANFEIQVINKEKFSLLPHDGTYFMGDVKKALEELTYQETLSEASVPFFIENYFKDIDDETMDYLGDVEEVGRLGGIIYAAIMKRFYNWGRCGHTNPIVIKHVVNNKTLATVTIPTMTLHETDIANVKYGDLTSAIIVTKNEDVIYKGKIVTYVKQSAPAKVQDRYKEEYQLVKKIIDLIPVKRREFDQFHLLNNMVATISNQVASPKGGCSEVNMAIDKCQWNMVAELTLVDNDFFVELTMSNVDPTSNIFHLCQDWKGGAVPLTKLITGLNTYRHVHSVPSVNLWSVGSFNDHYDAQFLAHREVSDMLEIALVEQGHNKHTLDLITDPVITLGDLRLTFNGTTVLNNLYSVEHHSFDTVYIFDEIYDIRSLNLPEPKVPEEKPQMDLGFFNMFRGLVAFFK